jgi:hypothetical protein
MKLLITGFWPALIAELIVIFWSRKKVAAAVDARTTAQSL